MEQYLKKLTIWPDLQPETQRLIIFLYQRLTTNPDIPEEQSRLRGQNENRCWDPFINSPGFDLGYRDEILQQILDRMEEEKSYRPGKAHHQLFDLLSARRHRQTLIDGLSPVLRELWETRGWAAGGFAADVDPGDDSWTWDGIFNQVVSRPPLLRLRQMAVVCITHLACHGHPEQAEEIAVLAERELEDAERPDTLEAVRELREELQAQPPADFSWVEPTMERIAAASRAFDLLPDPPKIVWRAKLPPIPDAYFIGAQEFGRWLRTGQPPVEWPDELSDVDQTPDVLQWLQNDQTGESLSRWVAAKEKEGRALHWKSDNTHLTRALGQEAPTVPDVYAVALCRFFDWSVDTRKLKLVPENLERLRRLLAEVAMIKLAEDLDQPLSKILSKVRSGVGPQMTRISTSPLPPYGRIVIELLLALKADGPDWGMANMLEALEVLSGVDGDDLTAPFFKAFENPDFLALIPNPEECLPLLQAMVADRQWFGSWCELRREARDWVAGGEWEGLEVRCAFPWFDLPEDQAVRRLSDHQRLMSDL